jgi:Sec-independent protein secretion pathway component TatC
MFIKFLTKPIYIKYWNQLLIKTYYNLFILFIIWSISLYNIDSILYFFAKDLLNKMDTPKFFFTNILEIFWMYLEISLYVSFFWGLPFFIFNYLCFFFNGFYKHEWVDAWKTYIYFFFGYVFYFFFIFYYILPTFLNFFLLFENSNWYFPLYFEARFEDYFLGFLRMFFRLFLILNCPFIIFFICKQLKISINKTIFNKKNFWLYFLLLSLIISPPEILIQTLIYFGFIFFYELFILFYLIFKRL